MELRKIAEKIISYGITSLEEKLPQLKKTEIRNKVVYIHDSKNGVISTDGFVLYVDEKQLVALFQDDLKLLIASLEHTLLHYYLGHPLFARRKDQKNYDLSSDLSVLCYQICCGRIADKGTIEKLESFTDIMEGCSYYKLLNATPERKNSLAGLIKKYQLDDHNLWYESDDSMNKSFNPEKSKESEKTENRPSESLCACEKVSVDTGYDQLKNVMEEYLKYSESSQDTDELDYIWYSYGKQLYQNIPIIEPLEETETPAISDLCIAIDTSGSCCGGIAARFLTAFIEILKEWFERGYRVNLTLFLADDQIQQEIRIMRKEEIRKIILPENGGGTNFIPVFERIKQLVMENKITTPKALFYLSDGMGRYPLQEPGYPVIFFLEGQQNEIVSFGDIPKWVRKIFIK